MRRSMRKMFMTIMITLSAVAVFLGMVVGPFGYQDISIGFSVVGILFACIAFLFALSKWTFKRRNKR